MKGLEAKSPHTARLTRPPRQARDLDIDAKPRSGQATRFAFEKLTVDQTKARAGESLARIDSVKSYADKKYWTQAKNELRRQVRGRSAAPPGSFC